MLILYFLHLIPLQGAAQYQAVKPTNLFLKETYVYHRYLQNAGQVEDIKLVKQEHSLLVKAIDFHRPILCKKQTGKFYHIGYPGFYYH